MDKMKRKETDFCFGVSVPYFYLCEMTCHSSPDPSRTRVYCFCSALCRSTEPYLITHTDVGWVMFTVHFI